MRNQRKTWSGAWAECIDSLNSLVTDLVQLRDQVVLTPNMEKGIEFLLNLGEDDLPVGRAQIDGANGRQILFRIMLPEVWVATWRQARAEGTLK